MQTPKDRQNNFFDTCSCCRTNYSCCHETTPPVTHERRKIIEAYLKDEKIRIENPFIEEGYVFPRLDVDGFCIFHDKKTRRCLIHPVKPETCVAGPITFDINIRTGQIEWFIKMEKICRLARVVFEDKRLLEEHIRSAKKEILRLVGQLDSKELRAILLKDEPETFKIGGDNVDREILERPSSR